MEPKPGQKVAWSRVSSMDIQQLWKMYPDFCPTALELLDCGDEKNNYYLKGRECDDIPGENYEFKA